MRLAGLFPAPLSHLCIAAGRSLGIAAALVIALTALASPGAAQIRPPGAAATHDDAAARGKPAGKGAALARGKPSLVHVKKDRKPSAAVAGPLLAVVSIARQRIQVYGGTGLLAQAPVSTGKAGHRTPTGVFSVLQKRRHHHSNIYSNAPMPYMHRLTWSGIALHAGVLPGYPASHGCIRLPYGFAPELWGMTKLGTRVVVAPDDAPVVAIEDPRLPSPRLAPIPGEDRLDEEAASLVPGPALASASGRRMVDAEDGPGLYGVPRLTPWQRATAARAAAIKTVAATAGAARLAADAAAARTAEARNALAALRRAETALAAAERRREAAARGATADHRPAAAERAALALATAEESLAEALRDAEEARLIEAMAGQEAFEAATVAAEAEEARREAAAVAAKATERGLEPISIFVSRKTGRAYIRQAWEPLHEAPVRFLDGPPLGTHVYLATGAAADDAALRWLSVSLPASMPRPQRRTHRRGEPVQSAPPANVPQETAPGALARFELPEATRRFIADRLWAGATLIVSDQGISGETGPGTDFIVLTR